MFDSDVIICTGKQQQHVCMGMNRLMVTVVLRGAVTVKLDQAGVRLLNPMAVTGSVFVM